jgi:aspartate kinase
MAVIVQKYGGTSVGSVERIQSVAQRVKNTVIAGNTVVVVVSAMGKTTDGLVNLAKQIAAEPSRREMDMLLSTGEQVTIALMSMAPRGNRTTGHLPNRRSGGNCHGIRT